MAKAKNKFTSIKDSLFEKLKKQREEIEKLLKKDLVQSAKIKNPATGQKLITIVIRREQTENEVIGLPHQVKATPKDVFPTLSTTMLGGALAASIKANTALMHGRIEDGYDHFSSAERSLGAAVAMSFVNEVNSRIAGVKGKISHATRTYPKKKQVLEFWRKNIPPEISARQAATIIDEQYLAKSGAIAYPTLCEWISAEKKKSTRPS